MLASSRYQREVSPPSVSKMCCGGTSLAPAGMLKGCSLAALQTRSHVAVSLQASPWHGYRLLSGHAVSACLAKARRWAGKLQSVLVSQLSPTFLLKSGRDGSAVCPSLSPPPLKYRGTPWKRPHPHGHAASLKRSRKTVITQSSAKFQCCRNAHPGCSARVPLR